jgi:hypothetical protein
VQQKGEGGGINASRESEQHPLIAYLGAYISQRFVNESGRGPICLATTNVVYEIAQHGHAAGGVHHLRDETARRISAAGDQRRRLWGVVGVSQPQEALG